MVTHLFFIRFQRFADLDDRVEQKKEGLEEWFCQGGGDETCDEGWKEKGG